MQIQGAHQMITWNPPATSGWSGNQATQGETGLVSTRDGRGGALVNQDQDALIIPIQVRSAPVPIMLDLGLTHDAMELDLAHEVLTKVTEDLGTAPAQLLERMTRNLDRGLLRPTYA